MQVLGKQREGHSGVWASPGVDSVALFQSKNLQKKKEREKEDTPQKAMLTKPH